MKSFLQVRSRSACSSLAGCSRPLLRRRLGALLAQADASWQVGPRYWQSMLPHKLVRWAALTPGETSTYPCAFLALSLSKTSGFGRGLQPPNRT